MRKKLWTLLAVLLLGRQILAQQKYAPGFVDPAPILAAAAKEIGEANFKCVTFSGAGYSGAVGQTFENADNIDWPRIDKGGLASYTRTINWDAQTSKEAFDRTPGWAPANWKYGAGWIDGTPPGKAKNTRQTFYTNGKYSWSTDGDGTPPIPARPEQAEWYLLDIYMNPVGFLKAARLPGANPVAMWRWEQIESGRDGPVVNLEKMYIVAIKMLGGKYTITATINPQNQIQRLQTWYNEPARGDFIFEQESTNQVLVGDVKWPTNWHSHHGGDDNWRYASEATGHNSYGGTFKEIQPNVCTDPVTVPESILKAPPVNDQLVTVNKLANGVYQLGGGPMNSYMIEFRDWVAVFEAPINEKRSLAVIEQVAKLAPNKPIRWVIVSHAHYDHIGGLRTYNHIGATWVFQLKNLAFMKRDILTTQRRTIEPDIMSAYAPTEIQEGYNYEAIYENYVITDNSRILHVYYVQPLNHVAGMLMAYLPAEHILFEADLFDTNEPPPATPTPAMTSLLREVYRLGLDVATVAPVHGNPVPWTTFTTAMGAAGNLCRRQGGGLGIQLVPCSPGVAPGSTIP